MRYLFYIFKSKYCIIAFILILFLSHFLIPKTVFYGFYTILAIIFIISFSLTITCIIRNIKEKILLAKTYKSSIIGIIATALGLAALQVCGFGAPVCGAAVGLGILSSILPTAFMNIISKYVVQFLVISIIFQLVALYIMNCFKKLNEVRLKV